MERIKIEAVIVAGMFQGAELQGQPYVALGVEDLAAAEAIAADMREDMAAAEAVADAIGLPRVPGRVGRVVVIVSADVAPGTTQGDALRAACEKQIARETGASANEPAPVSRPAPAVNVPRAPGRN